MKILLGGNPLTSIAGYLVAGLVVAQNYLDKGETNWWKIGIAVGIAILGRLSADGANKA